MNTIILEDILFEIDYADLLARLHVDPDSDDAATLGQLLRQAKRVASPKAVYRQAFVEDKGEDYVPADTL